MRLRLYILCGRTTMCTAPKGKCIENAALRPSCPSFVWGLSKGHRLCARSVFGGSRHAGSLWNDEPVRSLWNDEPVRVCEHSHSYPLSFHLNGGHHGGSHDVGCGFGRVRLLSFSPSAVAP